MDFIGIDKTVIKNFTVVSVDMDKLKGNNKDFVRIINIEKNSINFWIEQREDNFQNIYINDDGNMFNTLSVGVKRVRGFDIQYCILDLSIAFKGDNNLIPLTVEAYKQRIRIIVKYIQERYGVKMNMEELKFSNIELNATIELNDSFSDYIRTFDILTTLAPATYKLKSIIKNDNNVNMFKGENKSIMFKFYNKSNQLEKVYNLNNDKNILRVEYTIRSEAKMKDIFEHNELNKLNDDDIKEFIKNQFTKDFINRYEKFKANNKNKLVKIAKEFRKEKKQWIKQFLTYLIDYELKNKEPLLADVEDLREVIKTLDKAHFSRNWKQIIKNSPSSMINVNEKVQEIFNKISNI